MAHWVSAEFQFVQHYLFSIPKLRAMVGANRSLAAALARMRDDVQGAPIAPGADTRPTFEQLTRFETELAGMAIEEPLALFDRGIAAAAGGHFEVLVDDEAAAEAVAKCIRRIVAEEAPGLACAVQAAPVEPGGAFAEQDRRVRQDLTRSKYVAQSTSVAVLGHPFMEVCSLTGTDPAVRERQFPGEARQWLGARADRLLKQEDIPRGDPAGWVEQRLLEAHTDARLPDEFREFLHRGEGRRFLAVIAMDGNNVGESLKAFHAKLAGAPAYLAGVAETELFFYRLRVLNRIALLQALRKTTALQPIEHEGERVLPLRVLMLGGDDTLLVLRPFAALEFVQHFAREWDAVLGKAPGEGYTPEQRALLEACRDRFGAMTFKAGVALVPHNYPFHAASHLAEELASSAKAASERTGTSAVDWHVLFGSTPEPLDGLRQREYHRRYRVNGTAEDLVLTQRPYAILGGAPSLEAQWQRASALARGAAGEDSGKLARSKLKQMRTLVGVGRRETELLLQELRNSVGSEVQGALPQRAFEGDGGRYYTDLMDLAELSDVFVEAERLAPMVESNHD